MYGCPNCSTSKPHVPLKMAWHSENTSNTDRFNFIQYFSQIVRVYIIYIEGYNTINIFWTSINMSILNIVYLLIHYFSHFFTMSFDFGHSNPTHIVCCRTKTNITSYVLSPASKHASDSVSSKFFCVTFSTVLPPRLRIQFCIGIPSIIQKTSSYWA